MKNLLIKPIMVVTVVCISQFINSQELSQDLQQAVNEFNNAFKEGNVNKLSSMITQNYLHTNATSKPIDKETWISYLNKRRTEIETKKLIVHTYEMTEVAVRQYDDIAIISAKIVTSSSKDGKVNDNEYRVTNIWVKQDGLWKRAGFHDGKIK